jgi:hypothetical protein
MYILTISNDEHEGAYAVSNRYGENVLFIFEKEDDAERYCEMLEHLSEYPEMDITEVSEEAAIIACEHLGYQYVIITENDIVVPPEYAKIPKN